MAKTVSDATTKQTTLNTARDKKIRKKKSKLKKITDNTKKDEYAKRHK